MGSTGMISRGRYSKERKNMGIGKENTQRTVIKVGWRAGGVVRACGQGRRGHVKGMGKYEQSYGDGALRGCVPTDQKCRSQEK